MEAIRVLFVEDYQLARNTMESAFSSEVSDITITIVASLSGALSKMRKENFDIILLNISSGKQLIQEVVKKLKNASPDARIVIMTKKVNADNLKMAMDLGIHGHMAKTASQDEIVTTLRKVHAGEKQFDRALIMKIFAGEAVPLFTERERVFLYLLVKEYSINTIAKQMNLALRTVQAIKKSLKHRLHVKTDIGLALYAIRNEIV